MGLNSIGDNARAFALQNATNRLKSTHDILTLELSTGQVADMTQRVQGALQPLHHIENQLSKVSQYRLTIAEAAQQVDIMQQSLGNIGESSKSVGISLMADIFADQPDAIRIKASSVHDAFKRAISDLNVRVAGMSVFSGVNFDKTPLASTETILAELSDLTAAAATAAELQGIVDDWFSAPAGDGGFLDVAYRGSQNMLREIHLSDRETVQLDIDANNRDVINALKFMAMGALVAKGALSASNSEQAEVLRRSGAGLYQASSKITALQAKIGLMQKNIEDAEVQNTNNLMTLNLSRNKMTAADPYATSAALTEAKSQLEMLYALTARLSNLKLVDYLR